jgi:hypothetical protein
MLAWMSKARFENCLVSSVIGSTGAEVDAEVGTEVYTEVEIYTEVCAEVSIGSSDLMLIAEFSREARSLL